MYKCLAQAGISRSSSQKRLYFERSKCARNGLFSEKRLTIFAAVEVFW
jgi:hypothetical protein